MTNVFDEDWRDCLRAHYAHVIQERDDNNERSLITVLKQTGFVEDEITAMRTQTLITLGWYDPDQVDVPADPITETAAVEPPVEVIADVPAPEPQLETPGVVEAVEPPAKPPQRPLNDKPPKPPVQMSLF